MNNTCFSTSVSPVINHAREGNHPAKAWLFAAIACLLLLAPISGQACCGIGPQYSDFHETYSSQNDTNGLGNFSTAYEDLLPTSSGTITGVNWVGSYFNPQVAAPIAGFTITFYSDSANTPGAPLASFYIPGNAGQTFVQNDDLSDPTYQYGAPVDFAVTAGSKYWMSIVPDVGFPPQWGWETSSQGDGFSYQCFFSSCDYVNSDLAFWTQPTSTPEPGSLALLGSGVLGLGGFLRRRLLG